MIPPQAKADFEQRIANVTGEELAMLEAYRAIRRNWEDLETEWKTASAGINVCYFPAFPVTSVVALMLEDAVVDTPWSVVHPLNCQSAWTTNEEYDIAINVLILEDLR